MVCGLKALIQCFKQDDAELVLACLADGALMAVAERMIMHASTNLMASVYCNTL